MFAQGCVHSGIYGAMEEWIKDAEMLTAHRLENIPYNGTYDKSKRFMQVGEETVLNIFQGYHPVIQTVVSEEKQDTLIQPWIELAHEMCEGGNKNAELREQCFVFFRNVLAKKIFLQMVKQHWFNIMSV